MDFLALLPLFELGANVALTVLSSKGIAPANAAPFAQGVESAINPLLTTLKTGTASTQDEVLAGWASLIGVLNMVKQTPGIDAATVAKISEHLAAAQDGITTYLTAQKAFNTSLFTVNAPLDPA